LYITFLHQIAYTTVLVCYLAGYYHVLVPVLSVADKNTGVTEYHPPRPSIPKLYMRSESHEGICWYRFCRLPIRIKKSLTYHPPRPSIPSCTCVRIVVTTTSEAARASDTATSTHSRCKHQRTTNYGLYSTVRLRLALRIGIQPLEPVGRRSRRSRRSHQAGRKQERGRHSNGKELHASSKLPVATLMQATTVDCLGHTITDDGSSVGNFESIVPV
jgi:hypothetical protein